MNRVVHILDIFLLRLDSQAVIALEPLLLSVMVPSYPILDLLLLILHHIMLLPVLIDNLLPEDLLVLLITHRFGLDLLIVILSL